MWVSFVSLYIYLAPLSTFHSHRQSSMAEAAALVIRGVSPAALFDQCTSITKYIDAGTNCTDNCRDAAFMIALLGVRLSRCERTLRENPDLQATEEDGIDAEGILQHIKNRLQAAEKLGQRYMSGQSMTGTPSVAECTADTSRILDKLRSKMSSKNNGPSLASRARWALFDEDKINKLVEKLNELVSNLERVFPSLKDRRVQMARTDATGFRDSCAAEELSDVMQALKAAAKRVDKDFYSALDSSSHSYSDVKIEGDAQVNAGDLYTPEWVKSGGAVDGGGKHTYGGFRISGKSNVNMGNSFGGWGVFQSQTMPTTGPVLAQPSNIEAENMAHQTMVLRKTSACRRCGQRRGCTCVSRS